MKPGFVYLVQAENGLVKIGRSAHPEARLRAMADSTGALAFLRQIATDDMVWLEKLLHARFASKRTTGEWFQLEETDLAELQVDVWKRLPGKPDRPVSGKLARYEMRADAEFCDAVTAEAERWGLSIAGYIRLAVAEKMERNGNRPPPERQEG